MKLTTLFPLALLTLAPAAFGQHTPAIAPAHPGRSIRYGNRDGECDTVGFDAYDTGTLITDQYLDCGVVFENSEVHDYGADTYGRMIHSGTWFDSLVVRFVQPDDPGTPRLVQHVSFKNVIDPLISSGESDHISIRYYGTTGNLLYWTGNTSPSTADLTLGAPVIDRVVIDDSLGTAFALDDFVFDAVLSTDVPELGSPDVNVFPNPVADECHVRGPGATIIAAVISDVDGREVMRPIAARESGGWQIDLHALPAGFYSLRLIGSDHAHFQRLIKL